MARFNVGSFFKNAVKGAAQQYNQNVGFQRKKEADEEAAISASARDFAGRKELIQKEAEWKAFYNKSVPVKDDTKYSASYAVTNDSFNTDAFKQKVKDLGYEKFFRNGRIYVPRGANFESGNDQAKREDTYTQMSTVLSPKFLELFKEDQTLSNTMVTSLADAWQNNLVLEEDKTANGKKVYTFKKSQWATISKNRQLAALVAQRIGTSVKELDKFIKETGDYSDGSGTMYEFSDDKFAIGPNDFFRNKDIDGRAIFGNKQIDILKRIAPRTPGIDLTSPIKISTVANELNIFAKSQGTILNKEGKPIQKVTAGEIVDAIAVAIPFLSTIQNPSSMNNVEMTQKVKDKLQSLGVSQNLYNDPQVLLKILGNALPATFRYQANLQFDLSGKIDLKQQGLLKRLVGGSDPLASIKIKRDSAANLESDATQVTFLIDGGAESGASASIPRTISAFGGVVNSLMKTGLESLGGDQKMFSRFGRLFQAHQEEYNAAMNSADDKGKNKRIKNALLKFYATRMTFRLAADIQNTGGTQAGPRISDDDVARIQEGLQLLFLNDDNALRAISAAIQEDAERKRVIFNGLMSADVKEVAAAQLMSNMAGGDIVKSVFDISRKYKDKLSTSKFGSKEGLVLRGFGSVKEIVPINIDGNNDPKEKKEKDNEFVLGG